MNFVSVRKISPEVFLRLGLGLTYIYSSYHLFRHPDMWVWAIPSWFLEIINQVVTTEIYLRMQGSAELLMALILLGWYGNKILLRIVASFAAAEFAFILLFAPQFFTTFRDIGLLGAALALLVMTFPRQSLARGIN